MAARDVGSQLAPLDRLRLAGCSRGAPSARNLLVTVFGDALRPHGATTACSVRSLAALLGSFGINERLVRTSLSRLVRDGVLTAVPVGRRSFYRIAPGALDLFARADERIYGADLLPWDGSWTLVVVDGTEATPTRRARLRRELVWAGLGVVAPNVLASPVVGPQDAAAVVARVGGFDDVLVSRSRVVEAAGTLGAEGLARRCAPLDESAAGYLDFLDRFGPFSSLEVGGLTDEEAFKLRILLVASFRRLVLAEPRLPAELLPGDWAGDRARALVGDLYRRCADRAEAFLAAVAETDDGPLVARSGAGERFEPVTALDR